jgi:hypothetical protein
MGRKRHSTPNWVTLGKPAGKDCGLCIYWGHFDVLARYESLGRTRCGVCSTIQPSPTSCSAYNCHWVPTQENGLLSAKRIYTVTTDSPRMDASLQVSNTWAKSIRYAGIRLGQGQIREVCMIFFWSCLCLRVSSRVRRCPQSYKLRQDANTCLYCRGYVCPGSLPYTACSYSTTHSIWCEGCRNKHEGLCLKMDIALFAH